MNKINSSIDCHLPFIGYFLDSRYNAVSHPYCYIVRQSVRFYYQSFEAIGQGSDNSVALFVLIL